MTTDSQRIWLKSIAQRIPILFKAIAEGQYKASFIIGHRLVGGTAFSSMQALPNLALSLPLSLLRLLKQHLINQ